MAETVSHLSFSLRKIEGGKREESQVIAYTCEPSLTCCCADALRTPFGSSSPALILHPIDVAPVFELTHPGQI